MSRNNLLKKRPSFSSRGDPRSQSVMMNFGEKSNSGVFAINQARHSMGLKPRQVSMNDQQQSMYTESEAPSEEMSQSENYVTRSQHLRRVNQQAQYFRNVTIRSGGEAGSSTLQEETQSQLDNLMTECNAMVPELIGRLREVRITNNHLIVPKGYRTQDLIGKSEAENWRKQLKMNQSIIEVLDRSKLNEEVEMMLAQQKYQAKCEAKELSKKYSSTLPRKAASSMKLKTQPSEENLPAILKPLQQHDSPTASGGKSLEFLIEDMTKEGEITYENFEKKESMRKYERDDYKVKAFLMLIKAGKKQKMWMPGKSKKNTEI